MSSRGSSSRLVLLILLAFTIPLGLAACGSDDDSENAQQLTFTTSGDKGSVSVSGVESADTGTAEITLENDAEGPTDLQLIRTEGKETTPEAADALLGTMQGKPLPDWFIAAGGVGETEPGESSTVTQVLEPGTYFAFDTSGDPVAENAASFTVEGDASDAGLEADATVATFEYGFKPDGLVAGNNKVLFDNIGAQPHHIIFAPIKEGSTIEDVEKSIKGGSGPPPIVESESQATAVLDGGQSQLVDVELESGAYALVCFISDRQGGPPHALKGMIQEVDVK
ncbi:MAG: hypothetical protein ACSLFI_08520 [Solirubrobacterales bacterium]